MVCVDLTVLIAVYKWDLKLLIFCVCAGYVSYRHIRDGSPFIGVFCQQMKLHAANEHLTDIMIKVKALLKTSIYKGNLRLWGHNS